MTRTVFDEIKGIEDTRAFAMWVSGKINYAKGRFDELRRAGNSEKVNEFLSSLVAVPFSSVSSPSSAPAPDSSSPLSPSLHLSVSVDHTSSNLSPLSFLSPSSALSSLNMNSPSSSAPSHSKIPSCQPSTSSSPLPSSIHPSCSKSTVPPSSSHSIPLSSPQTRVPPLPPHHSSSTLSPPSVSSTPLLSQSPPTKKRFSIPGATPRGRPLGSRTGMRTQEKDLPDSIEGVRDFYLGKLSAVNGEMSAMRESAREERKNLRRKLKRATARRGGAVSQKERALAQLVKQLRRKIRDFQLRAAPVPVSEAIFTTKTENGFLDVVKYACLRLATLGVSDSKMGEVMKVVAEMLDVCLSDVPAASTIRDWIPALSAINQIHAAELLDKADGGLTLLRDETTKKGDKIQQHAVALGDQILILGFTLVVDKSALIAFDALRAKIESLLPFSSSSSSPSQLFEKFIRDVQNLMSDRASTETLFNKIFKRVRDSFLELREGADQLSPEEKEKASYLCVHFCQLHCIANLFGVVSRELIEQENEARHHLVDSSSAGFAMVLREVTRFLAVRSAGGHPEHKQWMEWCKKVGILDRTIPALLGERFNIQFLIAARIFKLREDILKFIDEFAPKMAFLIDYLTNDLVLVQLQILGLLDQKITGPLWRVAENVGVIEAGIYHRDFLVYIDACIDSPALFFSGECPSISIPSNFELFKVDGPLLAALVTSSPSPLARSVAVRVLRACATYLRETLSQSLEGGEYCNPSPMVAQCVQSAPTTNRAVESAFALMDHLYHRAPFMRFYRREATVSFVLNGVGAWLNGKSKGERTLILQKAFERRKQIVCDEREKATKLGEEIVRKMEARKVENEGKALSLEKRKTKILQEIGGSVLISDSQIDCAVARLGHSKAINLIKGQLRYRKVVLEQSAQPGLYKFSEGGVPHSLETLIRHLKELVRLDSISGVDEEEQFCASLRGRTCMLSCDIWLSEELVLTGPQIINDFGVDESGEAIVYLDGASGLVILNRQFFDDCIDDELIFPL